jgi:hypothetical protein
MAVINYEYWIEIHKNYSDNVNTGGGAEYFYQGQQKWTKERRIRTEKAQDDRRNTL